MSRRALFEGLVFDEFENPVEVAYIGEDAFYVIDDEGFRRHVESAYVDLQVLNHFRDMIDGHEDLITEGTMKMLGQEDIFTKAVIESQLKDMDAQFDALLEQGLPAEARTYLGMMGFRVEIDIHGDVIHVEQPGTIDPEEGFD